MSLKCSLRFFSSARSAITLAALVFCAGPVLAQSSVDTITAAELAEKGYPFPTDPPADADHQALVNYAWRLFIAANQIAGQTRGEADSSTSFIDSGGSSNPNKPLVWETFYHRSEAYPFYDTSGSKPPMPDTSTSQLPTYYFNNGSGQPFTVKNGQWNNLDENNEIGQNSLYFPKGTPHPTDPTQDSQVLYQAKVNANELNYVYPLGQQTTPLNFDFPTTGTGTMEIKSAWRLASDIGDTSRYHTAMATYYTGDENNPKAQTAEFALLALHIIVKTSNHPTFIFTTFEQIDSVIAADGSTSTGLYYIPSYTQIEYLPQGSSQNPSATHTGAYTTIKPTTPAGDTTTTTKLPPGGPVPSHTTVVQPKTITSDAVNVSNQVHGLLPSGSVWQYYALKGVQSLETNTTGSGGSRKGDETSPDYYLANIVVESSQPGVQLFRGGAPGPNTVNGKTVLQPQLTMNNVTAPDGTMVNIGGCKGCHGVAQGKGQDFSFLANAVGTSDRAPGFSPDVLPERGTSVETIRSNVFLSPRKLGAGNY